MRRTCRWKNQRGVLISTTGATSDDSVLPRFGSPIPDASLSLLIPRFCERGLCQRGTKYAHTRTHIAICTYQIYTQTVKFLHIDADLINSSSFVAALNFGYTAVVCFVLSMFASENQPSWTQCTGYSMLYRSIQRIDSVILIRNICCTRWRVAELRIVGFTRQFMSS